MEQSPGWHYAMKLVARSQAAERTQLTTAMNVRVSRAVVFLSEVFMA